MIRARINANLLWSAPNFTETFTAEAFGCLSQKAVRALAVFGLTLGLTACGGGGGSTSDGTNGSSQNVTTSEAKLVASPDTVTTQQNTSVTVDVLANDRGFDALAASLSIQSDPSHGTVLIRGDGTIAYNPEAGFSGIDTFVYRISSGVGAFAIATATVKVTCSNCAADARKMTLKWEAVPGNVLGYIVYFGKGLVTSPSPATSVLTRTKVTFDAIADLGLSPGDYACFWVQAVNAAGTSDLSAPACGLV